LAPNVANRPRPSLTDKSGTKSSSRSSKSTLRNSDFTFTGNSLEPKATYAKTASQTCNLCACRTEIPLLSAVNHSKGSSPDLRINVMALFDDTGLQSRPATVVDRAYAALSNTIASLAAWNDARRTHDTLSQLSAHELEDIGLHRGDIDRIARRTF
jgi:uncharacterized protein YjiS (DUF1127 family)